MIFVSILLTRALKYDTHQESFAPVSFVRDVDRGQQQVVIEAINVRIETNIMRLWCF